MVVGWRVSLLCSLLLCDVTWTGIKGQLPNSNIQPGVPVHVKTNDPGVQKAARFGVYRYNNSSNDIFLFKESCINNATIQVVKGLKYRLDVDIRRTVCRKRVQPDLDQCDFQRNKKLRQETILCRFIGIIRSPMIPTIPQPACWEINSDAILKCGLYLGYREFKFQSLSVTDLPSKKVTSSDLFSINCPKTNINKHTGL